MSPTSSPLCLLQGTAPAPRTRAWREGICHCRFQHVVLIHFRAGSGMASPVIKKYLQQLHSFYVTACLQQSVPYLWGECSSLPCRQELLPFFAEGQSHFPACHSAGGTSRNLFVWLPASVDQSPFPLADIIKTSNGEWIGSQCPRSGYLRQRKAGAYIECKQPAKKGLTLDFNLLLSWR